MSSFQIILFVGGLFIGQLLYFAILFMIDVISNRKV